MLVGKTKIQSSDGKPISLLHILAKFWVPKYISRLQNYKIDIWGIELLIDLLIIKISVELKYIVLKKNIERFCFIGGILLSNKASIYNRYWRIHHWYSRYSLNKRKENFHLFMPWSILFILFVRLSP